MLETTFADADGNEARLTDCFAMREGGRHAPYHQILRVVDGVRGRMRLIHYPDDFDARKSVIELMRQGEIQSV